MKPFRPKASPATGKSNQTDGDLLEQGRGGERVNMDSRELNELCNKINAEDKAFFDEAFKNQSTPESLKRLSARLCRSYGIRGICDPQYIANIIAFELGLGNGLGVFNEK